MTKSSITALSNSTGPLTRSVKAVRPSGTLKRIARGVPFEASSRASASGTRPLAADVAPHLAARLGGLARLVVLLGRREVVVRVAGRDQLFGGGAVSIEALRLEVRSVRAADVGPFVPVHAEPAHPLQDAVDHLVRRSLGVGVLDAQHEHAALAAGEEPVEQGGAGAADVQITGGRWGETYANHNSSECNRCDRPPYRRYDERAIERGRPGRAMLPCVRCRPAPR